MRHLLLILMIALLPLRGWVGDAMATGMAASQLRHQPSAIEFIAYNIHESRADGHFDHEAAAPEATEVTQAEHDCAGHTADNGAHAADAHCESCAACQACHAIALSLTAPDLSAVLHVASLPHAAADQFASADAALGQKPPIS